MAMADIQLAALLSLGSPVFKNFFGTWKIVQYEVDGAEQDLPSQHAKYVLAAESEGMEVRSFTLEGKQEAPMLLIAEPNAYNRIRLGKSRVRKANFTSLDTFNWEDEGEWTVNDDVFTRVVGNEKFTYMRSPDGQ